MAYAYTSKLIEIKSDGTPWRPMSHIRDISAAFAAVLEAPAELVKNQSFNVGMRIIRGSSSISPSAMRFFRHLSRLHL